MIRSFVVISALAVLVAGCGSSYGPGLGGSSSSFGYRPGFPSFEVECLPQISAGKAGLDVYVQVTATTLTFLRTESGFAAALLLQVRLKDNEGESRVAEVSWPETVFVSTYAATQSHPPIRFQRFIPIAPGSYRVSVQLEDLGTGKVAVRGRVAVVPEVEEGKPGLGGLLLLRRAPGRPSEPVVSFHIPLGRDTLIAHASILNVPAGTQISMLFTIVRFTVDAARASAPYRFMPTVEVMENRKLLPERADTVVNRWETRRLPESGVLLDDVIPPLPRGVYQIALRAWGPGQDPADGSAALALRHFVLVGPAFPRPALLDELVDCTAYLAHMNEQQAMDTVSDQQEKRRAFDHFWLSLFPDPARAASMMRLYFGRIEESNRLFSTFKEGWRTDRGMVYVILGPPERVEKVPDSEIWYYSHPGTYAANVYRFRRVFFAPSNLSVEEFLLRRSMDYETFWDRMVTKWRDGEVF